MPPVEPPETRLPDADEPEPLDPVAAAVEDFVETVDEPAAPEESALEATALDVVAALADTEAVEEAVVALSVVTLALALASMAVASVTAAFRSVVSSRASS